MPHFICTACGTQHAESQAPPARCAVCEDDRQFVPADGQNWTTLAALRADHHNEIASLDDLVSIETTPSFAIGQRALLVPYGQSNLLWDCVALLDDETAEAIEARGGLAGIAISHPHYYTTMVEWARRFDCPIFLHADDGEWVMRPDPAVRHWDGATLDLGDGLTLIRTGGHFAGATVLHRASGDARGGSLLVGDIALTVQDRDYVTFMWSYPNLVPLHADDVRQIAEAIAPYRYDSLHTAFRGGDVSDAERAMERSAARYIEHVSTPRAA